MVGDSKPWLVFWNPPLHICQLSAHSLHSEIIIHNIDASTWHFVSKKEKLVFIWHFKTVTPWSRFPIISRIMWMKKEMMKAASLLWPICSTGLIRPWVYWSSLKHQAEMLKIVSNCRPLLYNCADKIVLYSQLSLSPSRLHLDPVGMTTHCYTEMKDSEILLTTF